MNFFEGAAISGGHISISINTLTTSPKVVSLKQKGGGKEFELRSQTPTKQP